MLDIRLLSGNAVGDLHYIINNPACCRTERMRLHHVLTSLIIQNGVLVSDPKSRDVKIDQYTLSFHGRLLIEGAEIALNYGQR